MWFGAKKQKGHPRSLTPHGDAMKIMLRGWPLCPWYLRDWDAAQRVRQFREPLRWAPAMVARRRSPECGRTHAQPIHPVLDA
uniref:Uncharacterized protein n=1 Tax=Ralstonia solanacearum TaxID=305 RepID=A0A0S4XAX0_RALSL|nr:conserved protein of unknown function [Ralstonia solanacearum]CUV35304.1 conserved protein of unknown function [Ralstonia solanacearum]CUV37744.1 conserved protein of unknown function [Ralstonia solanacearum]CUV61271.1 conserved protein of unknown function [Ralstonia solanacearum]